MEILGPALSEFAKGGVIGAVAILLLAAVVAMWRENIRLRDRIDQIREGQLEQAREDGVKMVLAIDAGARAAESAAKMIESLGRLIEARRDR